MGRHDLHACVPEHVLHNLTVDFVVLHQQHTHSRDIVRHVPKLVCGLYVFRFIDPQGKRDLDYASLARAAVYLNRSLHLIDQLLYDGHTQPNTVIVRSRILMLLCERLKNVLFEILTNTDPRVLDHEPAACRSGLEAGLLRPDKSSAIGPVISNRIVDHIRENLF